MGDIAEFWARWLAFVRGYGTVTSNCVADWST